MLSPEKRLQQDIRTLRFIAHGNAVLALSRDDWTRHWLWVYASMWDKLARFIDREPPVG